MEAGSGTKIIEKGIFLSIQTPLVSELFGNLQILWVINQGLLAEQVSQIMKDSQTPIHSENKKVLDTELFCFIFLF